MSREASKRGAGRPERWPDRLERWSRSWLVGRLTDRALFPAMDRHLKGRLLDIGCGAKPLAKRTASLVEKHVGVDHPASQHGASAVDAFSTAYRLPFRDGAFGSAVCTAVLEHLEEPEQALRECLRVLSPGAAAIYTAPFIWHLHEEPRDFYRYSRHGLDYLFRKAGFEVVEISALSGFWATFGQLLVYNLFRLNRSVLRRVPVIPAVALAAQAFFLVLDRLDRTEEWTWAYQAVVRKPGA